MGPGNRISSIALTAAAALASSHANTSLEEFKFSEIGLGPTVQRQQGTDVQLPPSLNKFLFVGDKAFKLTEESKFITSGGIKDFAEWSQNGLVLQLSSVHQSQRGTQTEEWAELIYVTPGNSANGPKIARHQTPHVILDKHLSELSSPDISRHILKAKIVDDRYSFIEVLHRPYKQDGTLPKASDPALRAAYVVDMSTGRKVGSPDQYWIINEDEGDIAGVGIGRQPYTFFLDRTIRPDGTIGVVFHTMSGSATSSHNLIDGTALMKQTEGNLVFVRPVAGGKPEKVYYNSEVGFSDIPFAEPPTSKPKFIIELKNTSTENWLHALTPLTNSNSTLPTKILLGSSDRALLSESINPNITVAFLNGDTWTLKTLIKADFTKAAKMSLDAKEQYEADQKSQIIADSLEKLDNNKTDFSKMSDEEIRSAILGSADLSSIGGNTNLFTIGNNNLKITREGSDIICSFNVGGKIFEIVPGGVEIKTNGGGG